MLDTTVFACDGDDDDRRVFVELLDARRGKQRGGQLSLFPLRSDRARELSLLLTYAATATRYPFFTGAQPPPWVHASRVILIVWVGTDNAPKERGPVDGPHQNTSHRTVVAASKPFQPPDPFILALSHRWKPYCTDRYCTS